MKNVVDGYVYNFFIKKGFVVEVNVINMSVLKGQKEKEKKEVIVEFERVKDLKEMFEQLIVELSVKFGEGGCLFGFVISKQIVEVL